MTLFNKVTQPDRPAKDVSMDELVDMIRDNPNKQTIYQIRGKAAEGDQDYKNEKLKLPVVTPFGTFAKKNDDSMESSSGYVYLDLDNLENPKRTKGELIRRHGDMISVCCLSCSGTGLSVFVKTDRIIDRENVQRCVSYVQGLFEGFEFDKKIKDVSRAWFVSQDKDVYHNKRAYVKVYCENAELDLSRDKNQETHVSYGKDASTSYDIPVISRRFVDRDMNIGTKYSQNKIDKGETPKILKARIDNSTTVPFPRQDLINIDTLLKQIRTSTYVDTKEEIYIVSEVRFCKIYIPRVIPDNKKRKTFAQMVHQLMYINEGISRIQVISFLNYVNSVFARPKMEFGQMVRLADSVMKYANEYGIKPYTKIKRIHFKEKSGLNGYQKLCIAAKLNGLRTKELTVKKAIEAIIRLEGKNMPVNQSTIAIEAGMSRKTIQRRWGMIQEELEHVKSKEADNMGRKKKTDYGDVNNQEMEFVYIPEPILETDSPEERRRKEINDEIWRFITGDD